MSHGVVPALRQGHSPRVVEVRFSLMTGEQVKEMSVAQVKKTAAFDRHQIPKPEGVNDLRLGTPDRQLICQTCFNKQDMCPGHMGHIELAYPVYHIWYLEKGWLVSTLRCLCFWCCRLLQKRENVLKDRKTELARLEGLPRLRYVWKLLSGTNSKKPRRCVHCEGWQPEIIYRRKKSPMDIKLKWKKVKDLLSPGEQDKTLRPFTPREALEMIEGGLPAEEKRADLEFIGFCPLVSSPSAYIITNLPVPPPPTRPSRSAMEGTRARGQDDMTNKLNSIQKVNLDIEKKVLNQMADSQGKPHGSITWRDPSVHVPRELWVELQAETATLFFSDIRGIKPKSASRTSVPKKAVADRLKGKQGRFRGNLSGKRTDFCMRAVASPDSNIDVDEVGIPECNVRRLHLPEPVTSYNREELQETVRRGPNDLRGAKYIIDHEERNIYLTDQNCRTIQLELGWTVCRYPRDGDYMVVNRQPSLHKFSLMGHRVVILPYETCRLNLSVTTPYNADFDGDEINIHVAQSFMARVEVEQLMAVHHHIISPQNNAPLITLVQDSRAGSFLTTILDCFFTYGEATQLLCQPKDEAPLRDNWTLPPPAIVSPVPLWTGKQLYSLLLPKNLFYTRQVRDLQARQGHEAWMDSKDRWVEFQRGEMMSGTLCGQTIGGSPSGLIHYLVKIYGGRTTTRFLSDAQRMVNYYMLMRGFSVGIDDCLNPPMIQQLTDDILTLYEAVVRLVDETAHCLRLPPSQDLEWQTMDPEKLTSEQVQRLLHYLWGSSDAMPVYQRLAHRQARSLLVASSTDPDRLAAQDAAFEATFVGNSQQPQHHHHSLFPSHLPLNLIHHQRDISDELRKTCLIPGELVIDNDELEQFAWTLGNRVFGLLGRIDYDMKATHHSDLKTMVDTKSKGNPFNRDQMEKALGQQSTERGMRIHLEGSTRVLNHERHSQLVVAPSSVGYVRNGLTRGLLPWEIFFHAMGSREGLIDTAVKTSETGYYQRSMIKNMESLQVRSPDEMITNSNGEVVQWIYGDDGMDPVHLEFVPARFLLISNAAIIQQIEWIHESQNDHHFSGEDSKIQLWPTSEDTLREYQEIDNLRGAIHRHALKQLPIRPLRSTLQVPVHVDRMLEQLRHDGAICDLKKKKNDRPRDPFESVEEYLDELDVLCAQLSRIPGLSSGPPISNRDTTRQALIIRSELRSRKMLLGWKIDRQDWQVISQAILKRYFTSLISSGDMVGVLAAMSIGEPATQMTLNVFHYSGFAAKNVTLGMPRLKELIGTIKRCAKPMAYVFLVPPFSSSPAGLELARRALEEVSFLQAIQKADVLWRPLQLDALCVDRDQPLIDLMLSKRGLELSEDEWDQEWCRSWTCTGLDSDYDYCQRKWMAQNQPPIIGGETPATVHFVSPSSASSSMENDMSDWVLHFTLDKKKLRSAALTPYEVGMCLQAYLGLQVGFVETSEPNMQQWHLNVRLRGVKPMIQRARQQHPSLDEESLRDLERSICVHVQSSLLRSGITLETNKKKEGANVASESRDSASGKDGNGISSSSPATGDTAAVGPGSAGKILGLSGLRGIRRAQPAKIKCPVVNPETGAVEEKEEWMIQTEGTSLLALLGLSLVDATRTYSNDPREVMEVLGVRAATTVLADEIRSVISFDGTYVDDRHFKLAAHTITHYGILLAMSRHGIKQKSSGTLERCSYEETVEMILEAAALGEINPVGARSVTPNIFLGQTCPFGTGSLDILCHEDDVKSLRPGSATLHQNSSSATITQISLSNGVSSSSSTSHHHHHHHHQSRDHKGHHHQQFSLVPVEELMKSTLPNLIDPDQSMDWQIDEPLAEPINEHDVELLVKKEPLESMLSVEPPEPAASLSSTEEWNPWAKAPLIAPSSPRTRRHTTSSAPKRRATDPPASSANAVPLPPSKKKRITFADEEQQK